MDKKELTKIYRDYNLTEKDVYSDKRGFTIVTRSGIEKIQLENVVIKAISFMLDEDGEWLKQIETFGSASIKNCRSHFLVEIAEKRALARNIIKTIGFTNTLGEDELKHQLNE